MIVNSTDYIEFQSDEGPLVIPRTTYRFFPDEKKIKTMVHGHVLDYGVDKFTSNVDFIEALRKHKLENYLK